MDIPVPMRLGWSSLLLVAVVAGGCRGEAERSEGPTLPGPAATEPATAPSPGAAAAPARSTGPTVDAPAAAQPGAPGTTPGPRIGALSSRVYVRSAPRPSSPEIGVLHLGAVIALQKAEAVGKDGCSGGWYAVEPEGFVCLDASTTLDVDHDPIIRVKQARHGSFDSALPFRWSASRDAPLYKKVPSETEQRQSEYELAKHLADAARLWKERQDGNREARVPRALESVDVQPATGQLPAFLADGAFSPAARHSPADRRPKARGIPTRSTVAWTEEFFAEGRSWVLTDDLFVVPKDKLVPEQPSPFTGVHLDDLGARLPLAFVRFEPKPKFRLAAEASDLVPVAYSPSSDESDGTIRDENDPLAGFREDTRAGELRDTGDTWPRLAHFGLTGRYRKQGRHRYLETSERSWIREQDATWIDQRPPRGFELGPGEKWIDISIFKGTLVAYEGDRAVFATLISPGANGYKRIDGKNAKFTTPTGTFRIEWKHRSTTMTPDPERMSYYLSEVPYTQFFHMPFALHAAYWHDRFGEPKSGGCVNLSPKDAKWLFDWTEPHVPDGWHGVRSGDGRGAGTWVRVR